MSKDKRIYSQIERKLEKAVVQMVSASNLAYIAGDMQLAEDIQKLCSKAGKVMYQDKVWTNCESAEEVVALFGDRL